MDLCHRWLIVRVAEPRAQPPHPPVRQAAERRACNCTPNRARSCTPSTACAASQSAPSSHGRGGAVEACPPPRPSSLRHRRRTLPPPPPPPPAPTTTVRDDDERTPRHAVALPRLLQCPATTHHPRHSPVHLRMGCRTSIRLPFAQVALLSCHGVVELRAIAGLCLFQVHLPPLLFVVCS